MPKTVLALIFMIASLSIFTHAQNVSNEAIPLKSVRRPSDDLIFQGQRLSAEQAWRLSQDKENPLDLSMLSPGDTQVWQNEVITQSDDIGFSESEVYEFAGLLVSNQGLVRFNAHSSDFSDVFTVVMEKSVHTELLRKNLLRKLGYIIPPMAYTKNITIKFSSLSERNKFINDNLPDGTYGAPSRWLGFDHRELKDDQLEVTFHDVVVLRPSQEDHYNLAMGAPPKVLTSRVLRSLIVPYALVNLGESVNKFPWTVGRVDNENLILPHFSYATMNSTIDDVVWMARKLEKLKREDFKEIVEQSFYPKAVEAVLIEKLVARRNSLLEQLVSLKRLEKVTSLEVNEKPDRGELLIDGQLTSEDWDGYATRFAHGQPESPLKDFQYFAFSKIQNSVLTNLLDLVNEKLSLFDPSEKRLEFLENEFNEGLEDFVETGEFKEFGVGTWFSPTLDGRLIMSRDIVIGNYLGTDNLVQLADTLGVSVSLGGVLGIEHFMEFSSLTANASLNVARTYTHLKPVKTLKQSFKEPYKNMIVPLLQMKLEKRIKELAEIAYEQSGDVDEDERDPRLVAVEELLEQINESLGVGESLIITDRITPSLLVSGGANIMETRVGLSTGVNGLFLKRLHLYRKDASTIQIYEDKGKGKTLLLSASLSQYIPVIRVRTQRMDGEYSVLLRDVNIDGDLAENPELFSNALGLYFMLEHGSGELLDAHHENYKIEGDFVDHSTKFSFLVWKAKYLKGNLDLKVSTSSGQETSFVVLNKDSQSGINYQSFVYELLNYYMGEWFADLPITPQLDPETFKNPGQSIFGKSETQKAKFEARTKDGVLSSPLLTLQDRSEGWSASQKKMKKYIDEINEKYGMELFDKRSMDNAAGLRLFDITVTLNIYEKGISRLASLSDKELSNLSSQYRRERRGVCTSSRSNRRIRTARSLIECGNLNILREKNKTCQKIKTLTKEKAQCLLELGEQMRKDIEFGDIIELIGEENIFLNGYINGFRRDSEILNESIPSNTLGRIRSKYWSGAVQRMKEILEIQDGEFHGLWMREAL